MRFLILPLVLMLSSFSLANDAAKFLPVCQPIVQQCTTAGFQPGDGRKDGRSLWADCVTARSTGKNLTGVTATQAQAKACDDAAKMMPAAPKVTK
jgi:hypothetical protein